MKHIDIFKRILLVCLFALVIDWTVYAKDELKIQNLELGYPCPGTLFYHFKADIELPQSSIIEVEVAVDGKVLRATDLKRTDGNENLIGHLLRAILKCKTDAEARQVGIEWATMQSRDLIKEGVPGIHYYILERSDNIARIVKSSS